MRHKFYFGLLLIFFAMNANLFAQNFWVPDANFRNKLKQLYPSCFTAQDSLITTCAQIQTASYLAVNNASISSLDGIQYFSTLDSLYCDSNLLTNLPVLPSTLTKLYCSRNYLSSLPILPASLTKLYCFYNQLTSLPALPASLTILVCSFNQLTSLPFLPVSLTMLWCSYNQLTSLPALPSSLIIIDCFDNQLTSLPALPLSLNILYCNGNQLSSLSALPNAIVELDCSSNQLNSLPKLPASLEELNCSYNNIISLPKLPDSLRILNCDNNQLSSLPWIPGYTVKLSCQYNPITCFPDIASRMPGSYNWYFIKIDSTLISCIPNLGTFPLFVVQSSQILPICSLNINSCIYNYTFGYVYIDANGNGSKDSLEQGLEIPVYYSGNAAVFPDSSGSFYASSDTGNINFQVSIPPYYTATNANTQTINVASGIVDTIYFGLQPIPYIKDLRVDLTSIGFLRPGFKAKYKLQYQNVGTDTLYNVQVKFLKPTQLANLSALPAANSVIGDTLSWNIASLIPFQHGDVIITDSVFANAVLGDTARAFAWIEPIVGDTTLLNNRAMSTNIIRGAYDPNDKSVSADSVLPNSTDNLEYTIRFQNTGTDTAFTVTLIDKLSGLLDVSSMQMISASHNYELSIVNGFAKWIFKNILLPDSNTNELESHGFVKFKIKPLPGLTVADSIPNEADIYFDYNVAVTTHTIVVNVVNPLQVQELKETELQIFPNPVQDILRIVNQQAGALGKIELINANGKVLETKTISTSTYTWNLQHLPAGTYILRGQGWGQKVVKE